MILDIKRDILLDMKNFDRMMEYRGDDSRSTAIKTIYDQWSKVQSEYESIKYELNKLSKSQYIDQDLCKNMSIKSKELKNLALIEKHKLDDIIAMTPNILDAAVPIGASSDNNVVLSYHNTKPLIECPLHHEDIAIKLGCWAREESVAMSGSRFIILKGVLAKLERALAQYALNYLNNNGFMELSIPQLVQKEAMYNTRQLPKFEGDFFNDGNYCLIPTGEIPLVNYFANKIIDSIKIVTAVSHCFRKEPGSLGRDTKGLIRLHQFQKVEMVAVTDSDSSHKIHLQLLEYIKYILDSFQLHYRVVEVCSGDIGFTAKRQFDVEVWMPSYNKYIEVASCSNCGDFQARRMNCKFIKDGDKAFAHTLNATGLACGRIIAAILENFSYDGILRIPEVLKKYMDSVI